MYGSSNIGVVVLGWRLGKLAGLNCQRLSQVKQGKLGKKKNGFLLMTAKQCPGGKMARKGEAGV